MPEITEWEFTADVASRINSVIERRPDLPFSEARCEQRGRGSRKRRDLTLLDRNNKPIFTGEVKMPGTRDGRSPLNESVVVDAHDKANAIGVEYFFTWNVNDCILWNTFEKGKSITERHIEFLKALPSPIAKADDVNDPRVAEQIGGFLERLLERCSAILSGDRPIEKLPLDKTFIRVWELAVLPIVHETHAALSRQYISDPAFKRALDKWMVEEQGSIPSKDEAITRENLERAAKFSSYVLANKIVFYQALRRQFADLRPLEISDAIKTADTLGVYLLTAFEHATKVTKDYETVFAGDFGDGLPLLSANAVDFWRDLLADTSKFDFTEIPYDVVGHIFENLLSPEERHKFGQHYTRSEIVDLINAFCIRKADAKVMDPSCGGGTFLVRAYQRKKDLSGGKLSHEKIIGQLYGTDISAYPVHLTTMNLATRDLKEGANYPLVARRDFFKTKLNGKIFKVPDDSGDEMKPLPKLDAIVGNPPYIRQEKITEYYGQKYKDKLQELVHRDAPGTALSGRSDIFCYFFTHSFALLEDDGYIGLLTSSGWLDTAYGFDLQKFLHENFEIIAIIESSCEPWFTGARVTTAATILRKQPDAEKRNANNVKFVWFKERISEFVTQAHSDEGLRRAMFEDMRDRIERLTDEEENDLWRVRVVNQAELFRMGCLSFDVAADDEDEPETQIADDESVAITAIQPNFQGDPQQQSLRVQTVSTDLSRLHAGGEYKGYKWGIFLRAPEIFAKLVRRGGGGFVPLGQIANIKRGITSGCDTFFFPQDITDERLAENLTDTGFKAQYGITRRDTERIRIVQAGDKSQHLIEAEYLRPLVFNLMEINSININPAALNKQILVVNKDKSDLHGKRVLSYIKYGEREGFNQRPTCASRNIWYSIDTHHRGDFFWTKAQRYRHIVPINEDNLIANCNLYDISTNQSDSSQVLGAILNSTVMVLFKHQFGRTMGGDPLLKTEVTDVKMMLVPDTRLAFPEVEKKLISALQSMYQRKIGHLVEVDSTEQDRWTGELAFEDRQELDDAVLELIGIDDPGERLELRDELYREITKLYRQIRSAEKIMQRYRSQTARRGRQTPQSIATDIWDELEIKPVLFTPLDFVPADAEKRGVYIRDAKAELIHEPLLGTFGVKVSKQTEYFDTLEEAEFLKAVADVPMHGNVDVPISPDICRLAINKYTEQRAGIEEMLLSQAVTFTNDETMQQRVVRELWKKMTN